MNDLTQKFNLNDIRNADVKETLRDVFIALEEKGYNPLSQLSGYLISGDPAFIPRYNDSRVKIMRLQREEIIEVLLRDYLSEI
ncbi:MAG: IreB family regulatory phosphoprotein [Culicoidibacterales bacterium]